MTQRPEPREGGFWVNHDVADMFLDPLGMEGLSLYIAICYYRDRAEEQDVMGMSHRLGLSSNEFARVITRACELGLVREVPAKHGKRAYDYEVPEDELLNELEDAGD